MAEADAQSERKREAEAEALQAYRYHVISSLPNLTHLDLQRISDSDRKTAEVMASRREDQKQHELRQKRARGQRDMAISRARATWNERLRQRQKNRMLVDMQREGDQSARGSLRKDNGDSGTS